jgi:uncharacterized protein YdaU (DUF1376 family)
MAQEGKIELLSDWLEKQVADSGISDGRIWQEMAMSERTFYRLKPKATELLNKRLKERQKLIEDTKVQETIEAVKIGLKSKTERLMILQTQVDKSLEDLENAKKVFDKVALRKVIRELQSEISKIEGDYAPEKKESRAVDKDGNDILPTTPVLNITVQSTPAEISETEEHEDGPTV